MPADGRWDLTGRLKGSKEFRTLSGVNLTCRSLIGFPIIIQIIVMLLKPLYMFL
jgi:hypothetical protein